MKKIIALALSAILLVGLIMPNNRASALENTVKTSTINSALTNWVLDQEKDVIYAISNVDKKLYFINGTTLQIEKIIPLNGPPTDIINEDGYLYVAMAEVNQIVKVDKVTGGIVERIYTLADPCRIVKLENKIFYSQRDQHCKIYVYDMETQTDKLILGGQYFSVYNPDLALNKEEKILYIGESGSSGSNLYYYSIAEDKIISTDNYDDGYGFPYSSRIVLYNGENVFYAGRDFDKLDARKIHGIFGGGETINYVGNDMVFSGKNIYNKNTHSKIGEFKDGVSLIELNKTTLYVYDATTKTIKRFRDGDKEITSGNVATLIGGVQPPQIPETQESKKVNKEIYSLEMKYTLKDWTLDEGSNTVYAISESGNKLLFLNSENINLEKTISFTSSPTDLLVEGDRIYVTISDINQIVVIDKKTREIIKTLYTMADPYTIVANNNKLYYAQKDQHCNIYEYDLTTNLDKELSIGLFYFPDLAINKEKNLLYIGESGSSGSNLAYYSITENKIVSQDNFDGGYGFPYPKRKVIFDGESVFYAGRNFSPDNATRILGKYADDTINYVSKDLVFTLRNIYDKNTYELLQTTDYDMNLIEISSKNNLYMYNEADKTILRVEPDVTPPEVVGVKDGGVYYGKVQVTFDEGTATMNGDNFKSGTILTKAMKYEFIVVDEAGNTTKINFELRAYKEEDINKDGIVDVTDLSAVASRYNRKTGDAEYKLEVDINKDSIIDIYDLVKVSREM